MTKSFSFFLTLAGLLGLLLAGRPGYAQVPTTVPMPLPGEPSTTLIRPDTAEARITVVTPEAKKQKAAADSAKRTERMFRVYVKPKVVDGVYYPAINFPGIRLTRPGKAALLAALLPGAGQIYNRRYWKLPLVYGALGGVIYGEIFFQKRFTEFGNAVDLVQQDPTNLLNANGKNRLGPNAVLVRSLDGLNSNVVFLRGNRDLFYLYIGLAYSLQIVDALVDAHLRNFDVSDDLTLHWEPTLLRLPGQTTALPSAPGLLFALRLK